MNDAPAAPINTRDDHRAKPPPRRRRWLRRVLLGLGAALLSLLT